VRVDTVEGRIGRMRFVEPGQILAHEVWKGFGRIHSGRIGAPRMAGILYVVATPIGNLEDVTLRALRILREVALIAAEDTRRTAKLLQHYSISTRTTSLHEHNEHEKTPRLVERLRGGDSVALVSDAGTPAISDPGQGLVAAARAAGIRVESVPGASSVTAAISSSGLPAREFVFVGFPPTRSNDRLKWLERVSSETRLVAFFEAPHRIRKTLEDLSALTGPDRVIAVGRELTKAHEELVVKPISEVLAGLSAPRGEFTIVLAGKTLASITPKAAPDIATLRVELGHITEYNAIGRREAVKILAARYGLGVNELYRMLQE
jgi:16S rRNA (cytidine1402-2'-O)-methyltransferase